jgi:ribosome-associated protein
LGPIQRKRLLEKLGPFIRVSADDERSQLRNRDLALERLRSRLAEALAIPKARHPSKPSRAAKQRRLDDKSRRARLKQQRRTTDD